MLQQIHLSLLGDGFNTKWISGLRIIYVLVPKILVLWTSLWSRVLVWLLLRLLFFKKNYSIQKIILLMEKLELSIF